MNPRSETDVLAGMMGADSRRIDGLVDGMGQVRGEVTHLRGDVSTLIKGVDNLQQAMVGVARHAVLMEAARDDAVEERKARERLEERVTVIEGHMPGLIETRAAVMRAIWGVVAVVGIAVVGLVIKIQAVT